METKGIGVYDIALCPEYWSLDKVLNIAHETNYLFYDSWNNAKLGYPVNPPHMLDPNEPMTKILVDISTEEGKKVYEEIKTRLNGQRQEVTEAK